jgi:hypothetical protein
LVGAHGNPLVVVSGSDRPFFSKSDFVRPV